MSERTERYLERAAIVFLVLVALLIVAACDKPRPREGLPCKVGEQWADPNGAEVLACQDGHWKRYRGPGHDR